MRDAAAHVRVRSLAPLDATTATLTESNPLHAQQTDVTLPRDPLAARAPPPSRPQVAGIARPREPRLLGVLADVLQDLLDTTARGESYRERGQNIRYAWVMAQGGLSGLHDGAIGGPIRC